MMDRVEELFVSDRISIDFHLKITEVFSDLSCKSRLIFSKFSKDKFKEPYIDKMKPLVLTEITGTTLVEVNENVMNPFMKAFFESGGIYLDIG